LSQGGRELS